LPPYSPELNPVGNVWTCLRAYKLAITVITAEPPVSLNTALIEP
jgi:transposase